jgi:hypothetical protein
MHRLLTVSMTAVALAVPTTAAALSTTATLIAHNCQPVWVNGHQMIYNTRNSAGLWDAYYGSNCTGTPLLPVYAGHRGATDVTPDGRYVLLEVDMGSPPGQAQAEPGKGVGDEVELYDRQTGTLTQLTSGRMGTIWARFTKPDGSQIVFSQYVESSWSTGDIWDNLLGWWQMHLANIAAGQISSEQTFTNPNGNGFTETYGEIPGTNLLLFTSDAGVQPPNSFAHWLSSQIWTEPDTLNQPPKRLTPTFPTWWGGQESDYFEFATPYTDATGTWILTSLLRNAYGSGMDMWRIRPDGTGLSRVTWFGGNPCGWGAYCQVSGYPPRTYIVVGGIAINQADPTKIYAQVALDMNAKSVDAYLISP